MGTIAQLLADNLRFWRSQRGLTQDALSERMGVTITAVQNWESQRRWPGPESIEAAAEALGISADALFADRSKILQPTPQEALKILEEAIIGSEHFRVKDGKSGDEMLAELEEETFGKPGAGKKSG